MPSLNMRRLPTHFGSTAYEIRREGSAEAKANCLLEVPRIDGRIRPVYSIFGVQELLSRDLVNR